MRNKISMRRNISFLISSYKGHEEHFLMWLLKWRWIIENLPAYVSLKEEGALKCEEEHMTTTWESKHYFKPC